MDITFDRRTVAQCLQQRFELPTYQRDYKWEVKHLQELLTDIQEAFFENYEPDHGRRDVARYSPYFLGTIITTSAESGLRSIVDGQQRITTLALITTYYCRLAARRPELNISDITPLLRQKLFGQNEFNIAFDRSRKDLFEILLEKIDTEDSDLDQLVYSIAELDHGSQQIYDIFCSIDNYIDDRIKTSLSAYFVDYITQCVYLFEIGVPSEQDGHKVFVTMNDRGLKLGPVDLLKGLFLSRIFEPSANHLAHQEWTKCVASLKRFGSDEDSAFFKAWLRSQYAKTIRGKNKGDTPGDFEAIADGYHRWVIDNRDELNLHTADDFFALLTVTLPAYVTHYMKIRQAEEVFNPAYPHVFYNAQRGITLQPMLILGGICPEDSIAIVEKKIKIISAALDRIAIMRVVSKKENTYDNLRDPLFASLLVIRRKSMDSLGSILRIIVDIFGTTESAWEQVTYRDWKKRDVLHILARIAAYLEDELEVANPVGFAGYVDRSRGNANFDIEHLIPALIRADESEEEKALRHARDKLCSLVLLPRSRNRSLQHTRYSSKLEVYQTENVLAQTLTPAFYRNNPSVNRFIETTAIQISPIPVLSRDTLSAREQIYLQIIDKIWGIDAFDKIIDDATV